jgi:hypothetical protein
VALAGPALGLRENRDSRDIRSYHRRMPMWRCPHCGTPQAETARCWVCHRSTTACATCRHFRRSVAAQLGYCGLDRQRRPLRGDEIRGCWEAAIAPLEAATTPIHRTPAAAPDIELDRTPVRRLEFVEVGTTAPATTSTGRRAPTPARRKRTGTAEPVPVAASSASGDPAHDGPEIAETRAQALNANQRGSGEPRWSLWGDAES